MSGVKLMNELISRKTRNEFRELMVRWSLRQIDDEFENAQIKCDVGYEPDVSGQRRSRVEQHYHTLDFTKPKDVRRLLAVYGNVLERAEREQSASWNPVEPAAIEQLKQCLRKDGLKYQDGSVTAISVEARRIFTTTSVEQRISEVTRRAIFDDFRVTRISWSGGMAETEFLSRLYDLAALPSHDGRFDSMSGDIWQHRENNFDWENDWVFTDSRLDLAAGPDEVLLRFLCETVHPAVRTNSEEVVVLVHAFNGHLAPDGWELVEGKPISGRPTYIAQHRSVATISIQHDIDILSDEYVRELDTKCESRLSQQDLDGAVTVARTLLETVLGELELRLAGAKGDYKGDLPKQFKRVTKLLRMDEERTDLDERFKDVIRGLIQVANGLASIRNKASDGHTRARKPALHHARVTVNSARTVVGFLVESYHYQIEKGLLTKAGSADGART